MTFSFVHVSLFLVSCSFLIKDVRYHGHLQHTFCTLFNSQKLYGFVRHDDISSYFEVLSIFFVCVGRNI